VTSKIREQIVERTRLDAEGGMSGNTIERVTLRDGRTLIHKRVHRDGDWISRATGDDGRIVKAWQAGLFDSIPITLDHAMVSVEADTDGWSVFMRDVSNDLLARDARLDRSAVSRALVALRDLHYAFWEQPLPELCSIEDRYHLLSPRTRQREQALGNAAEWSVVGWEAFNDHVPTTIAETILPLVEDPTPVADELRRCEQTLVHGDLRMDNLGFRDGTVVLLDWGSQMGVAPPAVDFVWFLGFDALLFDCSREDVLADFRALYVDRFDERALQLAIIGGFVHLGCHFGLNLLGRSPTMARLTGDEDVKRAAAASELAWWVDKVDTALEVWSP
jgi:hypothetical protein